MGKIAVIDWETTGLIPETTTLRYTNGAQGIQIGIVVVDEDQGLDIVSGFTANVKYMGAKPEGTGEYKYLTWDPRAFEVHRIAPKILARAQDVNTVARQVNQYLLENVGTRVRMCGHNPDFDRYFTLQLFELACEPMKFVLDYRLIDTSTLGWAIWGTGSSYKLFKKVLGKDTGYPHDAFSDATNTALLLQQAMKRIHGRGKDHSPLTEQADGYKIHTN